VSDADTGAPTDDTADVPDAPDGPDPSGPGDRASVMGQARHLVWAPRTRIAVASLALIAILFLFVFPTRSYLAQKHQVSNAAHAVAVLKAQNAVLAREAKRLQTPSEIERLARQEFNMVLPGEQAYNVVNTPAATTTTAAATTTTAP
jgi:cell division protein FtsB